jgi:hypothetical protein
MSLPHAKIVLVVLAALAVATVGIVRLATPPAASAADEATVDSLTAQVTSAGWTTMDHDMSGDAPGYQMPPAMMPGMPENGDQRLAVAVTVVNTSNGTRPLRPGEEFALRAGEEGRQWAPHSDTFGDLPRLAGRNAVNGILFFDLPADELVAPAWIEWTHSGTTSRLTIPMDGMRDHPGHSGNP